VARALARTPAFERSRHHRKKIEMLFAHLKRILRLARLRLWGRMEQWTSLVGGQRAEPKKARQAQAAGRLYRGWGMTMPLQLSPTWLQSPDSGVRPVIPQS
jgi:hypothetical protein